MIKVKSKREFSSTKTKNQRSNSKIESSQNANGLGLDDNGKTLNFEQSIEEKDERNLIQC